MPTRRTAILAVDSVLAYALGYVISVSLYDAGLFAFGLAAGRGPTLYHDSVTIGLAGDDWMWVGGVVVTVLAGLALLSIFQGGSDSTAPAQLIVLWLMLHSFRESLTQLLYGPFMSDSDISQAAGYFGFGEQILWILAGAGAIGLVVMGLLSVRPLLRLATDQTAIVKTMDRLFFLFWLTFPAWVVGSLISLSFFLTGDGRTPVLGLPLAAVIVVALLLWGIRITILLPEDPDVYLAWFLVPVLAAMWAGSYFVLMSGITVR